MLRSSGHTVKEAGSGNAAKRLLGRDHKFDLILCDLIMADGTGMDLHTWLEETDQRTADRVIFMTGGAFTGDAAAFLGRVPNMRLRKPLDMNALQRLLHEVPR